MKDPQEHVCFESNKASFMQNELKPVHSWWAHTTGLAKPILLLGSLLCKDEEIGALSQ